MTPGAPFQPKREDGRSLRQVAYDFITGQMEAGSLAPGQVVKHAELAGAMEAEHPSAAYFQAVGQAAAWLQQNQHCSLVPVRGVGYRLIEGMAMVDKGRGEQRRGRRQISKAVASVESVDESTLETADQRTMVRQVQRGLMIVASVIDQQAEKISEHERDIAELKGSRLDDRARLRSTEAELAEIRDRLEAVERDRQRA